MVEKAYTVYISAFEDAEEITNQLVLSFSTETDVSIMLTALLVQLKDILVANPWIKYLTKFIDWFSI
jgi:hypothetical protein